MFEIGMKIASAILSMQLLWAAERGGEGNAAGDFAQGSGVAAAERDDFCCAWKRSPLGD